MTISVTNIGTAVVNSGGGSTSARTLSVPSGVPAGALIVVSISWNHAFYSDIVNVTDSAGNSYTVILAGATGSAALWGATAYAFNVAGLSSAQTITVNFTNSSNQGCVIAGLYATGIKQTSDPLDQSNSSSQLSVAPQSVSTAGATTATGELIVGAVAYQGDSTFTFTQDSTNEGGFATPPVRGDTSGFTTNMGLVGGNVVWGSTGTATYAPSVVNGANNIGSRSMIATFLPAPPPVTVALDWLAPLAAPVLRRSGISLFPASTLIPFFAIPLGWFYPFSEPVRIRQSAALHRSSFSDVVFTPSISFAWNFPYSEPVRKPSKAHYQQFFTIDARWIIGSNRQIQGWYQAFRDPVRSKPGLATSQYPYFVSINKIIQNPVFLTLSATESNGDIFLGAIGVNLPPLPTVRQPFGHVSITEVLAVSGGAIGIVEE